MVIVQNCELQMPSKSKITTSICPPRWYP